MKTCSYCGGEFEGDVCPHCGAPSNDSEGSEKNVSTKPEISTDNSLPEYKKINMKGLIVSGCVIGLVCLVIIASIHLPKQNNAAVSSSMEDNSLEASSSEYSYQPPIVSSDEPMTGFAENYHPLPDKILDYGYSLQNADQYNDKYVRFVGVVNNIMD